MTTPPLQEQCDLGQQELMRMHYVQAERILEQAEQQAWEQRDFDTLARLYMPLQEARRQRRQRCGEGLVRLDLLAQGPDDRLDSQQIIEDYPLGQLLVAGWGSLEPALALRKWQRDRAHYLENFLAAVYPTPQGRVIAIVPLPDATLPKPQNQPLATLQRLLPPHCLILREAELPKGPRQGTCETYAQVMTLWERLHTPFLAAADAEPDPLRQLEAYRQTLRVDYACELAHQRLTDVAKKLTRK
ncbi:MAG TPA: hypothetical protein VHP11_03795 [Tepidisphaeraceae bacterium]|nr:hypothetical protein [Tepidisphaeraceae bacterium]